ncbi:hypothetical protein P167DRAFT_602928 [Morchella conica CCBAS932]|uniref:Uncharacterized protein n=1 Tax=Morchella conica CCBAS932 TaxID=1392247 RepID=A0A3N4L5C9_9PEZI|nr:hypothetical protein P167DRAFT_602928 [Morchella conica CCBAS932]
MPSHLTTGEIIGTTLGVLSIITPLVILFISYIIQACKKGATRRPETSDEESRERDAPPPPAPATSGNTFHIREAHLSFYPESKTDIDAINPPTITYPHAVLSRDTIGGLSTVPNGSLSEMTRSMVHRIDTVNDSSESYRNALSTSDLEPTQIAPTEMPSTPDSASPPAEKNEKKAE